MEEDEQFFCDNCGEEMSFDQYICDDCEEEEQAEQDYADTLALVEDTLAYADNLLEGNPSHIVEMFWEQMKDRSQDW